jgi:hypothetical protein|tara:strand:+ start:1254 stop:1451 length:198 start_codon:yes stop_codon:yes gene_type:complete
MLSDLDEIKNIIQKQINQLTSQVGTGMCEDFQQYKNLTGIIEGLTRSIHVVDDYIVNIVDNLEED